MVWVSGWFSFAPFRPRGDRAKTGARLGVLFPITFLSPLSLPTHPTHRVVGRQLCAIPQHVGVVDVGQGGGQRVGCGRFGRGIGFVGAWKKSVAAAKLRAGPLRHPACVCVAPCRGGRRREGLRGAAACVRPDSAAWALSLVAHTPASPHTWRECGRCTNPRPCAWRGAKPARGRAGGGCKPHQKQTKTRSESEAKSMAEDCFFLFRFYLR